MPPPSTTDRESTLLNELLDRGYNEATAKAARAILNGTTSGAMAARLREFEAEAKRLQNAGLPLTTDNPVFQAMMYQFQQTLKQDAQHVNNAAGAVQENGVNVGLNASQRMTILAAGLPEGGIIDVSWRKPDPEAINAVVNYVNSGAWANELGDLETDTLNEANLMVIKGIIDGRNAGSIARDLHDFIDSIPLYKANNLLRTLQLQSYRDATSLNYMANSDILTGQIRIAALDGRTCLCCIALHGTELPLGERIDDHHSGRCTSIAMVKGMSYNIQSGSDWFNSLSDAEQIDIAGYANWNAMKGGAVTLSQFVQPYTDPVFGSMLRESSLKGIMGDDAQAYYWRNRDN